MADAPIDYSVVLADLKAKRLQIEAAIAAIEPLVGLPLSPSASTGSAGPETVKAVGRGDFLGMSIVDATVKLLGTRRESLRTEEIVSELRQGGIAFSTDTPINTVGSVLNRNVKQGGEIVSVGRGVWALAEWHPRLRRRPDKAATNGDSDSARPATPATKQELTIEEILGGPEPDISAEPNIPASTVKKTVDDFDDDVPF